MTLKERPAGQLAAPTSSRSPISARAVGIGLLGVVLISVLTPFNDYALLNTFLIGNNLPLAVVALVFALGVCVNGPLSRWAPRWAFSSGELTVILTLMLVGCAVPSSGLMRYLPGSLVAPWRLATINHDAAELMDRLQLPQWLFPTMTGATAVERGNSDVISGYVARWTGDGPIPYGAWARPAVAWGVFMVAFWTCMLCIMALVRRQWIENERLSFPLAQVQLALVEAPKPGRWFNNVFRARSFWVALSLVLAMRLWNGLAEYQPTYVPQIPLSYSVRSIFSERPFSYGTWWLYSGSIYFIVIGVTYFVSSSVAFSLWAFVIFQQIWLMYRGSISGEASTAGSWEQLMGGVLALAGVMFWVGRKHWRLILSQAFRGARDGEPTGRYLSYPLAFWLVIATTGVMVAWLTLAGMNWWAATVVVLLVELLFVMIARIIAETGLVYGQLLFPLYFPWQLLGSYGLGWLVPVKSAYLSGLMQVNFYDLREPVSVYAIHAMRVADRTIYNEPDAAPPRGTGRKLVLLMGLALLLAFPLSLAGNLWTEYHFALTLDSTQAPVNSWGANVAQQAYVLEPALKHQADRYQTTYSPAGHMGFGFALTALLAFLRLRFTWWPLHPVGYLMLPTTPTQVLWFSIFLGWLAKSLIIRLGGAGLYRRAAPLFMGLILGDCLAASLFLVLNLVLAWMGISYQAINIMPN